MQIKDVQIRLDYVRSEIQQLEKKHKYVIDEVREQYKNYGIGSDSKNKTLYKIKYHKKRVKVTNPDHPEYGKYIEVTKEQQIKIKDDKEKERVVLFLNHSMLKQFEEKLMKKIAQFK